MGFLGENNKPNEKKIYYNNEQNDLLSLQINYTLNQISQQYANKNNDLIKSPLSDYYCNYYLNNDNNNNIYTKIININEKREKRNRNIRNNKNYYNKFS